MSVAIEMEAEWPRPDRVDQAADVLRRGGLLAMPTDTTWIVACDALDRAATTRLRALRAKMTGENDAKKALTKPMSLMSVDLTTIGTFVLLDQPQFRLLRRLLPGAYTFILPASRQVPRQLQSKRRAVGIRTPDHPVAAAILESFGSPVLVATCRTPDGHLLGASVEVEDEIGRWVDAFIETQAIVPQLSTVLEWTGPQPVLVRAGKGPIQPEWET